MKGGDAVVWARTTGGTSTLALGEVSESVETFVKIRIIRTGAHFGYSNRPEVGEYARVHVEHKIMILPDKAMW